MAFHTSQHQLLEIYAFDSADLRLIYKLLSKRMDWCCSHRIGSVLPPGGFAPACAQVYVLDAASQIDARMRLPWGRDMNEQLVAELGSMLNSVNPFVRAFQAAVQRDEGRSVYMCITGRAPSGQTLDRRRYNTMSAPDIAVFIPDEEVDVAATPRCILVRVKGEEGGLKIISEYNAASDPLHFVLLFPRGELGWTVDIPSSTSQRRPPTQGVVDIPVSLQQVAKPAHGTVTLREYLAYYLMEREGQPNPLHRAGALFQEWTVLQWAKVEQHPSLFLPYPQ